MNRIRWLRVGFALVSAASIAGTLAHSSEVHLSDGSHRQEVIAKSENSQILVFRDGRQLHGELAKMDVEKVFWHRPDLNEALQVPRSEVRRIVLTPQSISANAFMGTIPEELQEPKGIERTNKAVNDQTKALPATVKLSGGDWLFGKLESKDGENFILQLEDGMTVSLGRTQFEWLYFSPTPTPVYAFLGSELDLEGWTPDDAIEITDGTAGITDAEWLGRTVDLPRRFELAFDVPAKNDTLDLWLKPIVPQINIFEPGAVKLALEKKEVVSNLCVSDIENKTTPWPEDDRPTTEGFTNFRVFYDAFARRVVLMRNGKLVGDWKFGPSKGDKEVEDALRQMRITSIGFDRTISISEGGLKLKRLLAQPWNGILPGADVATDNSDRLTLPKAPPVAGKLTSISGDALIFSGKKRDIKPDTFVQFTSKPAALADADAKVQLGKQGEFKAGYLEVRSDKLHCATSFASSLEIPIGSVNSIALADGPALPRGPTDILVFQNGDELLGKALSAFLPGAIRWKSLSGQELQIQSAAVAGIRLARKTGSSAILPTATVELRDGERLRGDLLALDGKQLQVQHPPLGTFTLDRSRLWRLFPNPNLKVIDGGLEPDSWMHPLDPEHRQRKAEEPFAPWVYLDGTYVLRHVSTHFVNGDDYPGLQCVIDPSLSRFEVCVEAAPILPDSGTYLMMRLVTPQNGAPWEAEIDPEMVRVSTFDQNEGHAPIEQQIRLQDKLPDLKLPRTLQLFVDRQTRMTYFFINDALIARVPLQNSARAAEYRLRVQPDSGDSGPYQFSKLWIGPWTGELPRGKTLGNATTALTNGDTASGAPKTIRDGKLVLEGEIGPLTIPLEKVQELDFGGKTSPEPVGARLRFADGSVLNVDQFQWDTEGLAGHSPALGDLHLPTGVISEIIFHPPALHAPIAPDAKKAAQHDPNSGAANCGIPPLEPARKP